MAGICELMLCVCRRLSRTATAQPVAVTGNARRCWEVESLVVSLNGSSLKLRLRDRFDLICAKRKRQELHLFAVKNAGCVFLFDDFLETIQFPPPSSPNASFFAWGELVTSADT